MQVTAVVRTMSEPRTWKDAIGNTGRSQDIVIAWSETYTDENGQQATREQGVKAALHGENIDRAIQMGVRENSYIVVDLSLRPVIRNGFVDNRVTIVSIKPYAPQQQPATQSPFPGMM